MIMRALAPLAARLRLVLIMALALPAILAAQPARAQFLAGQLESLLSTDERIVKIEGLSGALSGNVRIEQLTVADRDGVWLTARDLALDWSPLALVRKTVSIDNLAAAQIMLDRLPRASTAPADESAGGFSLPSITARVGRIAIAEFVLGEAVAGVPARLSAEASLNLAPDPAQLDANARVQRLDQPGEVSLRLGFQPDANRLEIAVNASEPAGGLVANLLKLPGAPPVTLAVTGSGPFDDFAANGTLDLGTERAATLQANVRNGTEGRRVEASLTALSAPFVPQAYLGVVGENLALDANVLLRSDGVVAIDTGRLVSGALQVTAAGTLDRSGSANDLQVTLRTDAGNPVALSFGSAGSQTALELSSLDATLKGAFAAAALDVSAAARTAGFEDYVLNDVTANAVSSAFDLNNLAGPLTLVARARNATVANTATGRAQLVASRVLEGPIALDAAGALTADGITFDTARLTTGAAELSLAGQAALNFSTFQLQIDSAFETAALEPHAEPYVGTRVRIAGNARRGSDGSLGVENLVVDGDALDIGGSASLTGETIAAAITGQLNQAAIAQSGLDGSASFTLNASGTTSAPMIDLTASASDLLVAGRSLNDLNARIQGTFAPDAPSGTIAVGGTYNGAPLALTADLASEGGQRLLRNLLLRQGENRIEGQLALDDENRPSGNLRIAVPNAATLLALAGQTGSGDLSGTLNFAVGNGGTPVADVALRSNGLTLGTNELSDAAIDLRLTDFLARPLAAGTVRAGALRAGTLNAERLDASLATVNQATAVNATVRLNEVPVRLSTDIAFTDAGTVLDLRTLEAAIPDAALSLAEPATITLGSLRTTISPLRLDAAGGSLTVEGSLGERYDLRLALDRFPAAIANPAVSGLAASGTLSGTASLTGLSAAPDADFDLTADALATSQTRAAEIAAVDAALRGRYRDGTATLTAARVDLGTGSIDATGTVGQSLDLALRLTDIPVALANGFVAGLDAEGTISGTANAVGSLTNPAVTFDIAGSGITAAEVRRAGVAPLTLDLSGVYRGGTARLETARVDVGTGRIEATGSVGRDLNLQLAIVDLPAALANGARPGLGASGVINGTAIATGSISNPNAEFQLTARDLTAAPLRQAGLEPAALDLAGAYGDGTARLDRARIDVGNGSLDATGTVGRTLDLRVALDGLPLALANAVRPDLDARGTLSGTASATGSISDPAASFDLRATDVSVAQTRAAGAPSIDAVAAGRYAAGTAEIQTARIDLGSGSVSATGSVGQRLDLAVTLDNVPASLANAAAPGIAPTGTLNGTVRAGGTIAQPNVDYDLRVGALTLQQTRDAGVGPLDIAARGTFADNRVTLDSQLTGSGLAFTAAGSVALAGPTFDLRLDGTAPLSLANRILAENGRSVQGTARVNAAITGTPSSPNVVGTVSTAGASFTDTGANLSLRNINADIALSGTTATLQRVTAEFAAGGTLSVGGTIGLGAGFPANLTIQVNQGRYADGELVSIRLDAGLTLTGPLTGDAVLAGTINASEINILVPDNLPTSLARIDLERRNAPAAVLQQIREIDPNAGKAGTSPRGGIRLDVTLNAPNRVFVRGRGLDLELGGTIRITGPVSNLGIDGGFELQRGRFQLLSRRLDFERASLTFDGNLVPTLDLLATSDTGEVTVNIAITGPATNPAFNFSSSPALPQDEVLARLIFGQGTADLSPLQIAQLASAAAQLAGVGGSTNLLDNLRSQLGVDDLDIRTNADGQTAVGVGRYLNDNTYVGVDSTGRVAIDLDLGANVKARGAVTAGGGGEVGIFYEREY
ncbi:translocation/assembly module TamB domain-containing protein [Aureimonas pseudogalii]|uniref:Translocation and assembly module TamB n=1 Tax=Aureimonas pseudogalii TaxID=1744844 RepID=A0A7W6EEA1_9HYPH|nr:translocation/assembly module TamB domain-containing protein [Aureimonas pseudogalii]MBB3996613.1 translocation and assembly module TamB [Aureimonas pseudogalii]